VIEIAIMPFTMYWDGELNISGIKKPNYLVMIASFFPEAFPMAIIFGQEP
jgi:hypothetical protein